MKAKSKTNGLLKAILCLLVGVALMLGASVCGNSVVAYADEHAVQKPTIVSVAGIAIGESNMGGFPSAIVGEEYKAPNGENYKVVAIGTGPLTYSANEYATGGYGKMPEGLHLNSETGEFSGTITSEGEFNVLIQVSNEYGSAQAFCRIKVFKTTDKPTITTESLSNGAVGSYYSQAITYSGYDLYSPTCNVVSGALPTGLSLGIQYGSPTVYGTPTETGTFTFTLSVNNGAGTATKEYSIEITNEAIRPSPIMDATTINESDTYSFINSSNIICVIKGKPVSIQLVSSGTNTEDNPITYEPSDTLPAGLTMSASGLITGTTAESVETDGSYKNYTIYVTIGNKKVNGEPQSTGTNFTIRVYENGYVQSINLTPAQTTVSKGGQREFSIDWSFAYGDVDKTDVTWSIYNGALPTSTSTTLSNTGLLNIGVDETRAALWIEVKHNPSGKTSNSAVTIIDHTHTTEVVVYTPKTCTADGCKKHYKCTICDDVFEDALATQTTTLEALTIAKGHEYGDLIPQQDATCSSTGKKAYYKCSACNKLFNSSKVETTDDALVIAKDETAHKFGTMTSEEPANCAKEGTKAHKDCTICHKHFDSDGAEITDLTIAKNDNHLAQDVWSKDNGGHWHACTREGCKDNGKLNFATHTKSAEESTETEDIHCTICEYIIESVKGHTHNLKLFVGYANACYIDGVKTYYVCSEGEYHCGRFFEDSEGTTEITENIDTWKVIPAGHTFGDWMDEVPATVNEFGVKGHKDCSVCSKHFDVDGNEIDDLKIDKLAPSDDPATPDDPTTPNTPVTPDDSTTDDSGTSDEPIDSDTPTIQPQEGSSLSGGAIAGIVVASVVVGGTGIFALIWFGIKKKSFADLLAVFKNLFAKK